MIRRAARRLGYDILKLPRPAPLRALPEPAAVTPVWPLPRDRDAIDDRALEEAFAAFPFWHYSYSFQGGARFATAHTNPGLDTDDPARPLQRFRHFMPYVIAAAGGTLRGKRVLDMACNSGFWSIQCALLGAQVVGFDARPELIAQAELVKRATGAATAEFRVLDASDMTPEALGGQFDIVLDLGLLYHLPEPLRALERTIRMSRGQVLLDTALYPVDDFLLYLKWEEPFDIRMAATEGLVAVPTGKSVELMLRHLRVRRASRIPVRSRDLPDDYRTGRRASWLIEI